MYGSILIPPPPEARSFFQSCPFEANECLGGGLHHWEDGSVPFDTGFHYLGEVQCEGSPLRRLLDYLAGGEGSLDYAALADCPVSPGVYDEAIFASDGRVLRFCPGEAAWLQEYARKFPGCERIVGRFREACTAHAPTFLPSAFWRTLRSRFLRRLTAGLMTKPARVANRTTAEAALATLFDGEDGRDMDPGEKKKLAG